MNNNLVYVIILFLIAILAIYFLYPQIKKMIGKEGMTTGVVINTTHPLSSIIQNAQEAAAEETLKTLKHAVPMTAADSTYVNGQIAKTSVILDGMVRSMKGSTRFDIESELTAKGPMEYAATAAKASGNILTKYKIHVGAVEGVVGKIKKDVVRATRDILSFAQHTDNDLSVFKVTQNNQATMDALMDFHLKRQSPQDKVYREVKPRSRDVAGHLKKIKTRTDDIIHAVDSDHPLLGQNGDLLPHDKKYHAGKPLNLEIPNLLAQNRRYYKKPQTVVRPSTDFRGMPSALIETIMKYQSSKDPNSLQQSVEYNPIDVLESGRGASNQHQTDEALARYFDQHEVPIVSNFAKILNNVVDKNPGNLVDNDWANDSIKNDIKYGPIDEYWGER